MEIPFKVGDVVRFGKYKNKLAKVIRFSENDKGQMTVQIDPIPKGRKQTKEMGLFKIWTTPDAIEAVAVGPNRSLARSDMIHYPGKPFDPAAVAGPIRKNRDPKALAFWRFIDRAAAQVDDWPDWMLHREPAEAGAKQLSDLRGHVAVLQVPGRLVRVYLKDETGDTIALLNAKKPAGCSQYEVTVSDARQPGWGPFIYDVAMELVHPAGLMSDRQVVSKAASQVWRYYFEKRADVTKKRLPAGCGEPKQPGEWLRHSYHKKPAIIQQLKKAKKLEKIALARTVQAATDELYHTTSLRALASILKSRTFRSSPDGFVSFSEAPLFGDISANDAVIVLNREELRNRIMPVQYTEQWYDRYPEHASYVAGEGWREQYQEPDECYDEDGWADDECVEQAYREAELQAFLDKRREREWVGRTSGDLRLKPESFKRVVVQKAKLPAVEALLKRLGLKIPVRVLKGRSTARVADLGAESAGPERDELLKRMAGEAERRYELHVYDFDGTLFKSPGPPSSWQADDHEWWTSRVSLEPPHVPGRPGEDWWVAETVREARNSTADPEVFAVVCTGRAEPFRKRVTELLGQADLAFDNVLLKRKGMETAAFKQAVIRQLHGRHRFTHVHIWEDRHVGDFRQFLDRLGVPGTIHPLQTQERPAQETA